MSDCPRGFLSNPRVTELLARFEREDADALARQRQIDRDNPFSRGIRTFYTRTEKDVLTRGETRDSSEVSSPPQPATGDR